MQLPAEQAASVVYTRFARYVAKRLAVAALPDLEAAVRSVDAAQVAGSRALDDLEGPVSEALADRDAADDDLDDLAQGTRHHLAAITVDAVREEPYVVVFPATIRYYIAATLGEQVARYQELAARLEAHLGPAHPLSPAAGSIRALLARWEEAVDVVVDARTGLALARTRYEGALEDWRVTMERTYGSLVALYGRKKAERFFPKRERADAEEDLPPTA